MSVRPDSALLVVRSAFQLLNAIEARHSRRLRLPGTCHLVLQPIADGTRRSLQQMKRLASSERWASVSVVDAPFERPYERLGITLGTALRHRADTLVVPAFQPALAPFYWSSRPDRMVVFDEGLGALVDTSIASRELPPSRWWRRAMGLCARTEDHAIAAQVDITRFTYRTDLDTPFRVVPNTYRHLRAKASSAPKTAESWLVGQPLVENRFLTAAQYTAALGELCQAASEPVVYLPHPREDATLVDQYATHLDMRVRRYDAPLEVIVANGVGPMECLGFYSTALLMLPTILGEVRMVLKPIAFVGSERMEPINRAVQFLVDNSPSAHVLPATTYASDL